MLTRAQKKRFKELKQCGFQGPIINGVQLFHSPFNEEIKANPIVGVFVYKNCKQYVLVNNRGEIIEHKTIWKGGGSCTA